MNGEIQDRLCRKTWVEARFREGEAPAEPFLHHRFNAAAPQERRPPDF